MQCILLGRGPPTHPSHVFLPRPCPAKILTHILLVHLGCGRSGSPHCGNWLTTFEPPTKGVTMTNRHVSKGCVVTVLIQDVYPPYPIAVAAKRLTGIRLRPLSGPTLPTWGACASPTGLSWRLCRGDKKDKRTVVDQPATEGCAGSVVFNSSVVSSPLYFVLPVEAHNRSQGLCCLWKHTIHRGALRSLVWLHGAGVTW